MNINVVSSHWQPVMDLQEIYSILLFCWWPSFSVLQGNDGSEEIQYSDQSQPEQEGFQHSFVKEHFQAQYK